MHYLINRICNIQKINIIIGSINEIINKYDDDINSITKTYDCIIYHKSIFDNKKNNKLMYYFKKGRTIFIIAVIVIIIATITAPVLVILYIYFNYH